MISIDQLAKGVGLQLPALTALARASNRLYWLDPQEKESGEIRLIEAPYRELKEVQRALTVKFLNSVPVDGSIHGKPGTSQISAARLHLKQPLIVTMDIKSFFPSVNEAMVCANLLKADFNPAAARLVTKICTRNRKLPQGAPTSPVLAQIVVTPILGRIHNLLADISPHCKMSLYVDDLTISGPSGIQHLIPRITKIWNENGFAVHPGKTKVMRDFETQEVLGIWLTDRLRPSQDFMRRYEVTKATLPRSDPTRKGMENWMRMVAQSN